MTYTFSKLLSRRHLLTAVSALALSSGIALSAQTASPGMSATNQTLKKYNVTVRRFDPSRSADPGEQFVLPVDSPDPEHAISAAMSNAVAFSTKSSGMSVLPVAFTCVAIAERR